MWIKKKTHKHFGAARGHMPHPKTPPPPKCCKTEDPKVKKYNRELDERFPKKVEQNTLSKKINCQGSLFYVVVDDTAKKSKSRRLEEEKNEESLFLLYFVSLFLYTYLLPLYLSQLGGEEEREREREREKPLSRIGEITRQEERRKERRNMRTRTRLFFREKSGYVWKSCCCCC